MVAGPDPKACRHGEPCEGGFEGDFSLTGVEARLFDLFFGDMVGFAVMEDAHHDAVNRVSMDPAEHVARACAMRAPSEGSRML